jgi:ABC-type branched-subunit amino acid transport system substrate-binding protein
MLDAGRWLNQRGGIYGRRLEILVIDDNSQVAEMMAAFRKLNEADRAILFYLYSIESAEALMPHLQFYRIPTFVSSLPAPLANPSKYPYVFSITPTIQDLSKIAHFQLRHQVESQNSFYRQTFWAILLGRNKGIRQQDWFRH